MHADVSHVWWVPVHRWAWFKPENFGEPGLNQILENFETLRTHGRYEMFTVICSRWFPGYSWEMVRVMEEKCRNLEHPVTFPVRAALMAQSFSQLSWLLQQSDRCVTWHVQPSGFSWGTFLDVSNRERGSTVYCKLRFSVSSPIFSHDTLFSFKNNVCSLQFDAFLCISTQGLALLQMNYAVELIWLESLQELDFWQSALTQNKCSQLLLLILNVWMLLLFMWCTINMYVHFSLHT